MSKLFERLIEKRGYTEKFLHPKYEDLSDPFLLPDMEKAVERLKRAAEKQEKVLIYGDYDVDGVTATAEMHEILKLLGIPEIQTMLPDRFIDGYGMSERVITAAKEGDFSLIVTVDCGSNNGEVIQKLAEQGIDVIITDHHELMGEVPESAVACVNPKRKDLAEAAEGKKTGGLKNLCGAGVVFMLARALAEKGLTRKGQEKWLLDLALIGTICDSMELTGENRIIAYYGMIVLAKTRRRGLKALMEKAGVSRLNAEAIGFQIGPRLNAAGRMETAEKSLKLLLTDSKVEAVALAEELDRLNAERRKQQRDAMQEVEQNGVPEDPVLIVSGQWHEGILGIIAGRMVERYRRPVFVLSEVEAGILKGSGRSFGDFSLAEALSAVSDLTISGGGHAGACGVKLATEKLEEFKREVNRFYESLELKNQECFLETAEDLKVGLTKNLSVELLDELSTLEPFGRGNAEPVFLLSDATVLEAATMGQDGKHLRFLVRDREGGALKLVAFNAREEWFRVRQGSTVSVKFCLMRNEWNGVVRAEGRVLDILGR